MSISVLFERLPIKSKIDKHIKTLDLKRNRVYIFPTAQGWLYCLMLIAMLFGAINYNNNMAFILCFLLTGQGMVCLLYTYRNMTGLIVSSLKPNNVFVKDPAMFPILIDNNLGLKRYSIHIKEQKKILFFKKVAKSETISFNIDSGKQQKILYPVKTVRRGILKSEKLVFSSCFPLGLFRAWAYFSSDETCIVYPSSKGQKSFPYTNTIHKNNTYPSMSNDMDDFVGLKKYHPGDPINKIAWKAYANKQELFIKQFKSNDSQNILFDWDNLSNINNVEIRLSQLCKWVLTAEKMGIEYGLKMPNINIPPKSGNKHKKNCLEKIACYGLPN